MTAALPAAYAWLDHVSGAPRMLIEARREFGVVETPGAADNPVILGWAKEVGLASAYGDDAIPWCGLFAAVVAKRASWEPVKDPLWARNWAKFGQAVAPADAALGDVLVFVRDGGGHVGFYVGEDTGYFHVLGGNQSDAVTITRIAKSRCIAVRRPIWRTTQPLGVVKKRLQATGVVSTNEA
jgi:uncharacterized protein (TIGR02594 family)